MAFWPPPGSTNKRICTTVSDIVRTAAGPSLGVSPADEALFFSNFGSNTLPRDNRIRRISTSDCRCCSDVPRNKPPCYSCIFSLSKRPPEYESPPPLYEEKRTSNSDSNLGDSDSLHVLDFMDDSLMVKTECKRVKSTGDIPNSDSRKRRRNRTSGNTTMASNNNNNLKHNNTNTKYLPKLQISSSYQTSSSSHDLLMTFAPFTPSNFRETLDPLHLSSPEEEGVPGIS